MHHRKRLLTLLTLAVVALGSGLSACATQQGVIERPEWAAQESNWEFAGLTVSTYGVPEYKSTTQEDFRQAEDMAMRNARRLVAREVARAYLKTGKSTLSEDEAARKLEDVVGSFVARQTHYDEQRRVYFIQLFVPASKIEDMLLKAFNEKLKLQNKGQLSA